MISNGPVRALSTVADICHNVVGLLREFPYGSVIVVLVVVVPVFLVLLPIFRWFTELLMAVWLSRSPFVRPPRPGLITAAEILTRGLDPDDFDFEQIDGVMYGRRRGT